MNNDYQFDPGQDRESYKPVNLEPNGHAKGYATASLILGIVGVLCCTCCCCCYYVSIVTGILSIVFACLSKRDDGGKMRGVAVAGLVLGIIAVVLFFAFLMMELATPAQSSEELLEQIKQIYKEKFGIDLDEYMKNLPIENNDTVID